ncbi:MAG: PSD1 and planctomycete cytochrome C domain-containing protein [Planctomycetes bacterium]|nr:PSD1 and planctomycete cytochrome C domain-containing protein [Planctomycetota bacterium]MCH9727462.1 PSD1 and planctomycete cytochrome C domain-containing protein [Planctomycetota bacterium]MCH9775967.1 PSD1 and planctomycete cytochrome C domain-containing protein [Planctomycetota bacterium]
MVVRTCSFLFLCTIAFVVFLFQVTFAETKKTTPTEFDFATDIRPLLSDGCFACHGPDDQHREADLRLDLKESAFGSHDGHALIVPGKPLESLLYQRIVSTDEDERMPPADSGKKLSPSEIEKIRKWIEAGAPWASHWAFHPPQKAALPRIQQKGLVQNPIDAFVLEKLEQQRLSFTDRADRVALLRRLNLDLVGLPPTIEEVDQFLNDKRPDAYQRQVQKLLASPHYGERWGRIWLDAARYADSNGYEKDAPREVWLYRDWVIDALNQNMPYNQFVIEQIAGDLLPNATQTQQVATGFMRNSMLNEEGGIDPEEFRMAAMFDRMDTIGKSVLGLTLQCGQCHTHKYDPLTQKNYYQIFACINNSYEASIRGYTSEEQQQRQKIFQKIKALEQSLKTRTPDWSAKMTAWAKAAQQNQPEWTVLKLANIDSNSQRYFEQADHSMLAQGYAPSKFTSNFEAIVDATQIKAIRLELLNHPNLPAGGPGRSIEGLCALTDIKLTTESVKDPKQKATIKFSAATADFENERQQLPPKYSDKKGVRGFTGPVAYAIDGDNTTAWGINPGPGRFNQPREAVFRAEKPFGYKEGTKLKVSLVQMHGGWNSDDNQTMNLGRFRVSCTTSDQAKADPVPDKVRDILEIPIARRTAEQRDQVFSYWRTTVPEWKKENAEIEVLWKQHPPGATQLVYQERPDPRKTHLLDRGDFLKKKEEIEPGVPDFLHSLPEDTPMNRLTFARWLVDRKSPTTARAIVNRVWQAYFGRGIVSTSEDLGSQGAAPTHRKLLDWMSVWFMDQGWDLKKLHTLIVTSRTYQQSSHVSPELYAKDPYNRFFARGPRYRVDAEIVRDIALHASGLLNPEVGGPSVYPPAPAFLFQKPASYGPKTWEVAEGQSRFRRAIYTFRFRSVPYPVLQAFDAPNGDIATVKRSRSNTPLQALTTLNETLFMECAVNLAKITLTESKATDQQRIETAFRRCVSRYPSASETQLLTRFLAKQRSYFADHAEEAQQISSTKKTTKTTNADFAAWIALSRVLLNMDETITKE